MGKMGVRNQEFARDRSHPTPCLVQNKKVFRLGIVRIAFGSSCMNQPSEHLIELVILFLSILIVTLLLESI